MGYFEYSRSDVMDILNIHEVTSWVFKYSKGVVMGNFEYS